MEERTNLNFSIPTSLSLKIDRLLIELKENGSIKKKTKPELLEELLSLGYKIKSKRSVNFDEFADVL